MKKILIGTLIYFVSIFTSFGQISPNWLRNTAISPDGNKVAFTYKGNIYTVNSSGGEANCLTRNSGIDYMPVWSPDGKSIAFASDRHGNFDIFLIPATGGTPKRLTFHSGNERPWSFSPDGSKILFSSTIQDIPENISFPTGYLSELYSVPTKGGRIKQILTTPAENAFYTKDDNYIIYMDRKGVENAWRKHHTSSVTRDILIYDTRVKTHTKLTNFIGEDRNPVLSSDGKTLYYLSEETNNNFNIRKMQITKPGISEKVTEFKSHPMRFLSISNNNKLCFSYDGQIYVKEENKEAVKLQITITEDLYENSEKYVKAGSGAGASAVSPDGKEVAFILRGNVFVTSTKYSTTKQITFTPGMERNVSFSHDGKTLLYASEKNGSWGIYKATVADKEPGLFTYASKIKEEIVIDTKAEEFQPLFSPNDKEIAYLEERVILKVINLESKKVRTILGKKYNYSYTDGDQYYSWSPDSEYLLVRYIPNTWLISDVGLIKADGKSEIKNLTLSGYADSNPKWIMKGKGITWTTDRNGYRSHGSWGAYSDIYAMFFTREAYDKFKMSKEEFSIAEEAEKEKNKEKDEDKDKKDKDKVEKIKIDFYGLEDRKRRLTINSSSISDAVLSPDGEKLYYLAHFEKGYDLWVNSLRKNETKLVIKLSGSAGSLQISKDGKNLFLFGGGKIIKISTSDYSKKTVTFNAEYYLNAQKERAELFEHAWRQMKKKFYREDMQGVDWDFYKKEYQKFLPSINNNFDFSIMLSEMLGEVNASHTGARYWGRKSGADNTANLGILIDWNYEGDGLKIVEILDKAPIKYMKEKITVGMIIEKIEGNSIKSDKDYFQYLNHKAGKKVRLSFYNPNTKKRFDEEIKLISRGQYFELLYQRWVKNMKKQTEKLSNGQVGYVHVRGMNASSFTEIYSEILGRNYNKKAIIVDTRHNGGGWLHDDLATLLSGKKYVDFVPRGQNVGIDPHNKWTKPSAVLVNEGNYSDAHGFPYVYQTLKIGDIVGMPVPGTMTAVWWERMQNGVTFGIPQVGAMDANGDYLENKQLEPEYKVENKYDIMITGRDQQLEKAVEILLKK